MPELYTTITIRAESEMYLQKVGIRRVMVASINLVGHLQYVRNVQVQSSFHDNLEECCVHYRDTYNIDIDPECGEASGFHELATDIMSLLKQLEDQSLRGFRSYPRLLVLSGCPTCQDAQVDNAIILKKNKLKKKGHYEGAKSPK
jgi:hypothetical protein